MNMNTIENNRIFDVRTFSEEEINGAKSLVSNYVSIQLNNDIDFDDEAPSFFSSEAWLKYSHALGSQFSYFFPAETYGNTPSPLTLNGLDSLMTQGRDCIKIMLVDINASDPDLQASSLLRKSVLPRWLLFANEYSVEESLASGQNSKSVRETIKILSSLGLNYKEYNWPCIMTDFIKVEKEREAIASSISPLSSQLATELFKI